MRVAEGPIAAMVSLLLAAVLFAAFLPLHARGAIGGGDVKLITALAVGLSPPATLDFLLTTVMAGGVLGVVYLSLRLLPQPSPFWRRSPRLGLRAGSLRLSAAG